ncbi:hypothetical protein [Streptomyces sp. NPDC048419]|uniref:hypothetical protein n=1 Tax=Streptomyces sp. NPDC048419 TaxID=3365547 RepID=UPI00372006B3
MQLAHGAHRFELECRWHSERWTKNAAVSETSALVWDSVDLALAAAQLASEVPHARTASETTMST